MQFFVEKSLKQFSILYFLWQDDGKGIKIDVFYIFIGNCGVIS